MEDEEESIRDPGGGGRGGGESVKKAGYLGKGNKYRKMVAKENMKM